MLKPIYFLILLITFLHLTGCQSENSLVKNIESPLFDLKGYFTDQMEAIKGLKCIKTVSINELTNTDTLDGSVVFEDLKLFQQYDPNKPALTDKYLRDTIFSDQGEGMEIKYTAIDPKIPTQSVSIHFTNNQVTLVVLEVKKKNSLYQFNQTLEYQPGRRYAIQKDQKVAMFSKKKYRINVVFVP